MLYKSGQIADNDYASFLNISRLTVPPSSKETTFPTWLMRNLQKLLYNEDRSTKHPQCSSLLLHVLVLNSSCPPLLRDDSLGHSVPSGQSLLHVHRLRPQQHRPHPASPHHPGVCLWDLLHPLRYSDHLSISCHISVLSPVFVKLHFNASICQVWLWWWVWCSTSPV